MKSVAIKLGQVVITPNALSHISRREALQGLMRHRNGDFGNVCEEDWAINLEAVTSGERILSSYTTESGIDFWIITEYDRSYTTILLPEDY